MSLAALIRKRPPAAVATAIPATSATHAPETAGTVAGIATVAVASPAPAQTAATNWLIHFADRDPLEVAFSPAATHAEVLANYPGALGAEPFEAVTERGMALFTGDQEAAIVGWLAEIGETDQAIIDDLLTKCRHDSDARAYYLGRAGHAFGVTHDLDDRRSCHQCNNLRFGVCVVAKPGGLVSAIRGYRPAAPEMLRRCACYSTSTNCLTRST